VWLDSMGVQRLECGFDLGREGLGV
jgi:hypothetical protein